MKFSFAQRCAALLLFVSCMPCAIAQHWVGTWSAAPAGPPLAAHMMRLEGQTLRLIVHASLGGNTLRVRLSNEFGSVPLQLGAVHLALRAGGAAIVPGSDRTLTFGGMGAASVPPGAPLISDPVALTVPAMADLVVSIYVPGTVELATLHGSAYQTNYLSQAGDHTAAIELPVQRSTSSWPFLSAVDVESEGAAVVVLGDSITDGAASRIDTNQRWPDLLAARLRAAGRPLAVLNQGIDGNRLLRDPGQQPLFGKSVLARFDRDVLAAPGAAWLMVLIGINDIGHPGTSSAPLSDTVTPSELIAGYRQLIARAHLRGLSVIGATLTPFEGTRFPGYFTPAKEAVRQAVNRWIREAGEFDGVADFDAALRDPAQPARLLALYDSGDHLHPNPQGMQAMANAVALTLFGARAIP